MRRRSPCGGWLLDVRLSRRQTANLARGELMFRGQCLACHTVEGYRPIARLLQGRDRQAIMAFLKTLHENKPDSPYRSYMPPLVGTPDEIEALADYLDAILNHNVKPAPATLPRPAKPTSDTTPKPLPCDFSRRWAALAHRLFVAVNGSNPSAFLNTCSPPR
jgi:cytochrome c553